jgi:hypothetical protein
VRPFTTYFNAFGNPFSTRLFLVTVLVTVYSRGGLHVVGHAMVIEGGQTVILPLGGANRQGLQENDFSWLIANWRSDTPVSQRADLSAPCR